MSTNRTEGSAIGRQKLGRAANLEHEFPRPSLRSDGTAPQQSTCYASCQGFAARTAFSPCHAVVTLVIWPRVTKLAMNERCHPFRFQHSDRKSTRLNSSHQIISYAVFC